VKPSSLVIHHSAGASGNVSVFRNMHKAKGWQDVAYHAVICNGNGGADGLTQAGRSESLKGAGVWGNNANRLQVCLVGNFENTKPTRAQCRSLGEWLHRCGRKYDITQSKAVYGHRELALFGHGTACPGKNLPLSLIREWFAMNITKDAPERLDDFLIRREFLAGQISPPPPPAIDENPRQLLRRVYKAADGQPAVLDALNTFRAHPMVAQFVERWPES
jgi:hypothetical protein